MTVAPGKAEAAAQEFLGAVAWLQIVGAGFLLLVALLMYAVSGVIVAATPQATLFSGGAGAVFGVGCVLLAGSVLVGLSGIGLRRRKSWGRVMSRVLSGLGALAALVLFALVYFALDQLLQPHAGVASAGSWQQLGLVLKVFSGGMSLAVATLLLWVARRLNSASVRACFAPLSAEIHQYKSGE